MSAASQREYRKAHKAAGMCTDCGNIPAVPGRVKCARHLAMVGAWWAARPQYASDWQKRVRARRNARTPEEIAADRARLRPDGLKWCKKRAEHEDPIPLAEFSDERGTADGLRSLCKLCDNGGIRRIAEAYWVTIGIPLECAYCPGPYDEVDHVLARRRGGTDDPANLLPACFACNNSKRAKPVDEWLCVPA
jgi:5-methylcytosine-specific restriction endonuclease McrA